VNRIFFVVLARKGHGLSFKKNSTVVAIERFIQSQRTVKITGNMAPSNFPEFRFTLGVQLKNPLLEKKTYTIRHNAFGELFLAKNTFQLLESQ
jgi:hypothetical protein